MALTRRPTILVSGTGTGIGKTHFADALLRALARRMPAVGWKPVESGAASDVGDDQARLSRASTPGLPRPGRAHVALPDGISPHLAAERAGASLPWDDWMHYARSFGAPDAPALVVELAGGLFSPLSITEDNARFALNLRAHRPEARLVLCAPDRLGVLHEVRSTVLGAAHTGLAIDAVMLLTPDTADASTGTNARELERTLTPRIPILGPLPRGPAEELASDDAVSSVLAQLG